MTLFVVSSSVAGEENVSRMLQKTADQLRAGESDVRIKAPGKGDGERVSRQDALKIIYRDLAALDYRQCSAAIGGENSEKAKAALTRLHEAGVSAADMDAKAVTINEKDLVEACQCLANETLCGNDYLGRCICCDNNGGSTVRSGREINVGALAGIDQSLTSVSRRLVAQETSGEEQAALRYQRGQLYERIAAAIDVPAVKSPVSALAAELTPKQIYQQDGPAVVLIICSDPSGTGELGSGSIIDDKGRVLTNAHVVVRESTGKPWENIRVYQKPEKVTGDAKADLRNPISARVARFDRKLDLALLELESAPRAGVLPLGDSDVVSAGDPVVAIGHPEQGGLWTLTTGIVSTVVANLGGVEGKDAFQTDASINRGNSGGPLIARDGRMIGINTSMARKAADGLTITSVNFSVKSGVVKSWLQEEGVAPQAEAPAAPEAPVAVAPAPVAPSASAPVAPAPVVSAPSQLPAPPAVAQIKPAPITQPTIVTPAKPYKIKSLIDQEIQEMEDLGKEMESEIQQRMPQP